jgi:hypothetical protein
MSCLQDNAAVDQNHSVASRPADRGWIGAHTLAEAIAPAATLLSAMLADTIWPTQNALTWPPRTLAAVGGPIGLVRCIDNMGIAIV